MAEKRIKRLASNRTALINSLLDKLEAKVQTGQRELLKRVLNDFVDKMDKDEDGNIKNTLENKRRFSMFDTVYNRFAKDNGLAMVQSIADGVTRIVDFNANYFSAFTGSAQLGAINSNVKETLTAWLGLTTRGNVEPNGYLDTLIKDATVKNQIKNIVLKSVVSQAGYFETKKALQNHIEGTPDKLGALQRYYRNFAYDTFSVVDRTNGKIFADKLKFNYAIYEGGLIETSRKFCEDHNGKVFSREEISKFKPTEAIGPGYDPFTDLGGFGCRHHLNWIPDSVAFALRPELKGQQAPPAKEVPPPVKEQPPAAQAKTFQPAKNPKEARTKAAQILQDAHGLQFSKLTVDGSVDLSLMNNYLEQLHGLSSEYNINPAGVTRQPIPLKFKSGTKYAGYIKTAFNGEIFEINFGSTKTVKSRQQDSATRDGLRYFSKVDDDKQHLSVITHEYAHVIATGQQAGHSKTPEAMKRFFDELRNLRTDYTTEIRGIMQKNNHTAELREIHLGNYASTNMNEFMAEAFTEYKLSSNPSKYATAVGKLIDKYFKR